ncbi:MAG: DNA replication/repair protein RecF [Pseudomonadales bacterium]|nr:DNA replication/repair protein RecF [Pseudomonadales bacterium]
MVITGLVLQNIRSHNSFHLKFSNKTTIIVGDNAAGKTSIIEAISLLSTGNSFRASRIEEMINFDADLARIKGIIKYEATDNHINVDFEYLNVSEESGEAEIQESLNDQNNFEETDEIEVILTRGEVNGKRTQHRLFSVNGVKRRKKDAIGKFYTVVFRPEDMRLIEGSPARRRDFLDTALSMIHSDYEVAIKNYQQTLKRRNKLLLQVREGEQNRTALKYWNINLVRYGEILQEFRRKFIANFSSVVFPVDFEIEYDPSVISESRLDQYLNREIASGHTLIGPHKDDIIIYLNEKSAKDKVSRKLRLDLFGSRGQQRLGVLWLKFCELEYLAKATNKKTLLLLDDILSELDSDSKLLAQSVLKKYQSIVTTTDKKIVSEIQLNSEDSIVVRV